MDFMTELEQLNLDEKAAAFVQKLYASMGSVNANLAFKNEMLTSAISSLEQDKATCAAKIKALSSETAAQQIKIQQLTFELAHLRRMRFGARTEAFSAEQRAFFEEDLAQDIAAVEVALEAATPDSSRKPRSRAGRQPLPAHLPRIDVRHELESDTCPDCQSTLTPAGEDITELLHYVPGNFEVQRHIRPKCACRNCQSIVAAPVDPALIDGGMATPALLSWVVSSKYLDHLPLYRIEQIAARQGVTLSRSTMSEWIGRIGVALQPLVDRLHDYLKRRSCLHADETPVRQLDPGKGKTKHAYLWAYRSNDLDRGPPIIVFEYQTSRSGKHARSFLGDWQGYLCVDDYSGYKALFAAGVTDVACWAHARRKFFDLHAAGAHPVAEEALRRIGRLYEIERAGKAFSIDARKTLRNEAQLELQSFYDWLSQIRQGTANGSGLAKACDYVLRRWPAFARYAQTGNLPIDNNPAENVIRPIAIGKKNWLFAGSERAGQRAAAIQSLLATANLNGLDPTVWLTETLQKLPTWPYARIEELLPLRP